MNNGIEHIRNTFAIYHWTIIKTILRLAVFIITILVVLPNPCMAQGEDEYYEISVFVDINRLGGAEIPTVILGKTAYVSITDLFNLLKIKNIYSEGYDTVSGFFLQPEDKYIIERKSNTIEFKKKVYNLNPGSLIKTETSLYLELKYFGEIFGLYCSFDFRQLQIKLETKFELPIMREIRLETIHQNIDNLKGETKADTVIKATYPLFSFGIVDWGISSTQQLNGFNNTNLSLAVGSIIAGGETNIGMNINSDRPITNDQLFYRWHFTNNDLKIFKQILAGRIDTYSLSTITNPVIGVQITNTPSTFRRAFGTYLLSDYTHPNWTVELYVNNVLVGYQEADASGFFTFEIPLVYGDTEVKMRFYGQWGEEESRVEIINIPFSFVPKNTLEYKISGGQVSDGSSSIYSRGEFIYGLGRKLSVGGGVEYLSSIPTNSIMPFVDANFSLGKLLFNSNYTYGVQWKNTLNYRFRSGWQLDLEYAKFDKDQQAIMQSYDEIRRFRILAPFRRSKVSLVARFSVDQYLLPSMDYFNSQFVLSINAYGVSTNISTYGYFIGQPSSSYYSSVSISYMFPKSIMVKPELQYDYKSNKVTSLRLDVDKKLSKGNGSLTLSYEENLRSNTRNIQIGFRTDLSFAEINLNVRGGSNGMLINETARGSIQYNNSNKKLTVSNRSSAGRGGLIIILFLDINNNGVYDKNEPKVPDVSIRVGGGSITQNKRDTTTVVTGLEAYSKIFVELSMVNTDNIAWRLKDKSMSITVIPNQMRLIEVPVLVVGEAAGMIYVQKDNKVVGQGRILVNFYNEDNVMVKQVMSESDGYYNYFGLAAGKYKVSPDLSQLRKLNMVCSPTEIPITILPYVDGDYVDKLDFTLIKKTETIKEE